MVRQGEKHRPLVALEAVDRTLPGRGMPADVGCALQPARGLLVEIVVIRKRAAVEEALADVASGSRAAKATNRKNSKATAPKQPGITKLALLVAHLSVPGGATIAELCNTNGH